ncbi:unnamed protein product [Parnassius apollo]|uniref:(apollo) hypothetical protein n=1 Tax=Parnassius apollo TaxID=110799 RepID=A0A8S3WBC1_PARAO|nr:unnamed protein product [Parnassius apollo]
MYYYENPYYFDQDPNDASYYYPEYQSEETVSAKTKINVADTNNIKTTENIENFHIKISTKPPKLADALCRIKLNVLDSNDDTDSMQVNVEDTDKNLINYVDSLTDEIYRIAKLNKPNENSDTITVSDLSATLSASELIDITEQTYPVPSISTETVHSALELESTGSPQKLTEQEELNFVKVLIVVADYGLPLTLLDLRILVNEYLLKNNKAFIFNGKLPGEWWARAFIERHRDKLTIRSV